MPIPSKAYGNNIDIPTNLFYFTKHTCLFGQTCLILSYIIKIMGTDTNIRSTKNFNFFSIFSFKDGGQKETKGIELFYQTLTF